jgi:pyrimidine-nucleoside phosphorylase
MMLTRNFRTDQSIGRMHSETPDPVGLIETKKLGRSHAAGEIRSLIDSFACGDVPDYQMAAWLMAVRLNGLDEVETADYTTALLESGRTYAWDDLDRPVVDKHSSGGVGDKTSLVVVPLAAACGLAVPKISGRGLGLTGGTLDKLDAIPGMRLQLGEREFKDQIRTVGAAIVAQSSDFVPADGKTYALREVTSTADSISLIAASIMCKKLATGADTIVLDVKAGSGAFMTDLKSARTLARAMVQIGTAAGRNVRAFVTEMNTPLGAAVGHSLEVSEALDTLRGDGPADLVELSLTLVAALIRDSGLRSAPRAARNLADKMLSTGAGYAKMEEMIAAQGGDLAAFQRSPAHACLAARKIVAAPADGYVSRLDARATVLVVRRLGGGRFKKSDDVDPGVGVRLEKKIGDRVKRGDALAEIYAPDAASADRATGPLLDAFEITEAKPRPAPLILDQIVGAT